MIKAMQFWRLSAVLILLIGLGGCIAEPEDCDSSNDSCSPPLDWQSSSSVSPAPTAENCTIGEVFNGSACVIEDTCEFFGPGCSSASSSEPEDASCYLDPNSTYCIERCMTQPNYPYCEFVQPAVIYDILCPAGATAPPSTAKEEYGCFSYIPQQQYYEEYCQGAGDQFFCEGLEQDLFGGSSSAGTCPLGTELIPGTNTCGNFDHACVFGIQTEACIAACQADPNSWDRCDLVNVSEPNSGSCGVDYNAMSNGSWQACWVLADGTAECAHATYKTSPKQVKRNGDAVTDIAQISAAGYNDVIVVTNEGQAIFGNFEYLPTTSTIESGVISATGGQNTACAIIKNGELRDVRCWTKNTPVERPALPAGFDVMQLSANYSDVCALASNGDAWCWEQKSENSLSFAGPAPSKAPFSGPLDYISTGQLSVCGVLRTGGVECLARWDSADYLPTKGSSEINPVIQQGMEEVIAFQAGFGQGISIHSDGSAKLWKNGNATPFNGLTDAVSAGGDRGAACVLTANHEVHCMGDNASVKVSSNAAEPACPM